MSFIFLITIIIIMFKGISGFESSSQYVQEQEKNVFPKTLKNMWLGVIIFNPLLSFLSLSIVKIDDIYEHRDNILSHMGNYYDILKFS